MSKNFKKRIRYEMEDLMRSGRKYRQLELLMDEKEEKGKKPLNRKKV